MSRGKDGKKGSHTRRTVLALMGVFAVLTAAFSVAAGLTGRDPWIAFSLVCGTTLYHIVMRLAVGTAVKKGAGRLRPDGFWFRPKKFEAPLYRFLRVGEWKKFAPTYDPAGFDMRRHTPDELIRSTCAAELTHEIAAAAGWLTLVLSLFTDDWRIYIWIFAATAFVAGAAELAFVAIQRFNRPRLIRLRERIAARRGARYGSFGF